ncbi:LPS-assembly protein LptD [Halioglobus maricola]|uniref:LPS-assembly protein LptD n=1 Tax=Halioglobus maricola TaxID=2601894 RepID=A0A5P9NFC0_9GAMM|nr:LPS-assembly protein LptD [Halioglobus maricola]QFU74483.1 LPS-assembly protein LptD [Halioglobus maricola]
MTNSPARPNTRKRPISLAVLLFALGHSASSSAQDNSGWVCEANTEGELAECKLDPEASPARLDWLHRRQVPKEQVDDQCLRCDGSYVDPLGHLDRSKSPDLEDIHATAGSTQLQGNTITLSDGVNVKQGYRHLSAESAILNRGENTAELQGGITLREPGLLLRAQQAWVDSDTGEAKLQYSDYVLHQQRLQGQAEEIERDADGILHVHNGQLSFCPPGEEDWKIRAENLELDTEEGLGVAHGARIDVAGVPIFYSPWMQFPLDDRRRTGFMWPDIGSDTKGGLDVSVPVYFNLAPDYDLLYSPRFIQERGINHEAKARYLNPLIGAWTVGGAWMNDDKRYEDEYPEERNHDRWLGVVKHNGLFDQRWRSRVDYSRASDVNYMKDLETSSLDSKRRTALLQLGTLDYLGDKWMANLELQQFQSLADDLNNDYKKLPQITGRYRPSGEPFKFDPILLAQYSTFDTDDDRVTGNRLYTEAGASYPMQWQYGFLNTSAKYRYLHYDLNEHFEYEDNNPTAGAATTTIDGGLYFDRSTSFAGRGLLQTLEPRLYYLYSGYDDQTDQPDFDSAELTFSYNQLFRGTRFSGRDRIDDANQLSMGLTTRFIDENDGREEFSASIGQIFYFRDREVRLDPTEEPLETGGSELAGELTFYPNERLSLRTSLIWDPYTDKMNSGSFQTSYDRGAAGLYNIGYSYRRPLTTTSNTTPTEQAHFSVYMPAGRNWRVFAAVNYSVEANTSVEDMFGVEYDSCCWTMRLLHLRYYDTDGGQSTTDFDDPTLTREHSTQFQIVLKGMGGFGSRASSIMKDMIRGFTDSEY